MINPVVSCRGSKRKVQAERNAPHAELIKLWNSLPHRIVNVKSHARFREVWRDWGIKLRVMEGKCQQGQLNIAEEYSLVFPGGV